MHVVVIYGWEKDTLEPVQAVAEALGIMAFEAQQRMIGGGPAVVAAFADPQKALESAGNLKQKGITTLIVDAVEARNRPDRFIVHHFELGDSYLCVENQLQQRAEIPYGEIDLLLTGRSVDVHSETKTVTERKFDVGKTIITGGIPITKKVTHQEKMTSEEHGRVFYLYAGNRPPFIFSQNRMIYDGLGTIMKPSREQNFYCLLSELRRRTPDAVFDDRLNTRAGIVRLLGPFLSPATNLDLAADILALSLRHIEP
ncbi:MAG: hypothetical protein R6U89_03035 [Dehalococcoidia bacterium]